MSLLRELNQAGVLRTLDDALAQSLRRLDPDTPDEVLAAAATRLPDTPAIRNALSSLSALARSAAPNVEASHIDLADLTGYHYHSGAIFSVFTAGEPNSIGRGGRYDGIGKAFGRARPATGFTLDLRQLAGITAKN